MCRVPLARRRGEQEEDERKGRKEREVERLAEGGGGGGFTRENRWGSAQHATRATPTRSSHGPMRA